MASIMPLLQQFLIARMAGGHSTPRNLTGEVAAMAVALVLICAGLVFCLYAENIWLKTLMSPELAALATAGSAFVLAVISVVTAKSFSRTRRQNQVPMPSPADLTKMVGEIIDSLGDELEEPIRENPKTAIMLASLAGFVAGEQRH